MSQRITGSIGELPKLDGAPTCYLFSLHLSYSGKAVHRVFAFCGQEAFFEGHVHALRTLGGVPRSKVRCDNLKAAVARVLGLSRARVEADGPVDRPQIALLHRKLLLPRARERRVRPASIRQDTGGAPALTSVL